MIKLIVIYQKHVELIKIMKLIQFNTNLLKVNKNDMFRAVMKCYIFSHLMFIVANSVLAHLIS